MPTAPTTTAPAAVSSGELLEALGPMPGVTETPTAPSAATAAPAAKRKVGRPKKQPARSVVGEIPKHPQDLSSPAAPQASAAIPPEPEPIDQITVAAAGAVGLVITAGSLLGGDEWTPKDNEAANMHGAFERYFRAKGISDLDPKWDLAAALLAYAGPRLAMPKTQTTLQKLKAWGINLWYRWQGGRVADRVAEVVPPN